MVSQASNDQWPPLVQAVLKAHTLVGAQMAASDLIDEVLPGGAAVSEESANLVHLIRNLPELPAHPYRGYMIAVLVRTAVWLGAWRRPNSDGQRPIVAAMASVEEDAERELRAACDDLAVMLQDRDPEVRSLMYQLVGAVGSPVDRVADLLIDATGREEHDVARACAIQGLVMTAARADSKLAERLDVRLIGLLADASPADHARALLEINSVTRTPQERTLLISRLGAAIRHTTIEPARWPAEDV